MTSPDNGRAAALSNTTAAASEATTASGTADGPLAGGGPHGVTREMLQADEIRRRFARLYPHIHILDDAELAQSLEEMLDTAPPGAFDGGAPRLFGYGSLMWNPCVAITERRHARVVGLHRSFCLWMPFGRGTPDQPGLMLALDRGGSCTAMTLMPDPADWRAELALIWRREMLTASYLPRWVSAQTPDGPVPALTFVINPTHERYAGRLTEDQTARIIARATGELGSSADYLRACVGALDAAGIHDRRMTALLSRVEYHQQAYTDMPQDISGR